jgi:hypothetical protein
MTNKETKSKVMSRGNKLAATMDRSAAFRQAWAEVKSDPCWDMDFQAMALGTVKTTIGKKLPLNLNFNGDRAVYMAIYRKEAGIPA